MPGVHLLSTTSGLVPRSTTSSLEPLDRHRRSEEALSPIAPTMQASGRSVHQQPDEAWVQLGISAGLAPAEAWRFIHAGDIEGLQLAMSTRRAILTAAPDPRPPPPSRTLPPPPTRPLPPPPTRPLPAPAPALTVQGGGTSAQMAKVHHMTHQPPPPPTRPLPVPPPPLAPAPAAPAPPAAAPAVVIVIDDDEEEGGSASASTPAPLLTSASASASASVAAAGTAAVAREDEGRAEVQGSSGGALDGPTQLSEGAGPHEPNVKVSLMETEAEAAVIDAVVDAVVEDDHSGDTTESEDDTMAIEADSDGETPGNTPGNGAVEKQGGGGEMKESEDEEEDDEEGEGEGQGQGEGGHAGVAAVEAQASSSTPQSAPPCCRGTPGCRGGHSRQHCAACVRGQPRAHTTVPPAALATAPPSPSTLPAPGVEPGTATAGTAAAAAAAAAATTKVPEVADFSTLEFGKGVGKAAGKKLEYAHQKVILRVRSKMKIEQNVLKME